jgi:hemoglobin
VKKDIEAREDVTQFVNLFYQKVEKDGVLGYIFTDIAKVNWQHHLPKMYDFWESVLFGKALFKGNPMDVHFKLNKEQSLGPEQFERWKKLFFETIDELFEGENASEAKKKANSIADLMHFKIHSPQHNSITIKGNKEDI